MKKANLPSRLVSGAFVIIASVSSVGCAVPVINRPMATVDLDHFQINCAKKQEQIALLQSMRSSPDDRTMAGFSNMLQPWQIFTQPQEYALRRDVGRSMTNWQINQNLLRLRDCP